MPPIATHLIVDGALSLLGAASALTWIVILQKASGYRRLTVQNRRFDSVSGNTMKQALAAAMPIGLPDAGGPKARVAQAAMTALAAAPAEAADRELAADITRQERRAQFERLLARQIQRERRMQEAGLTLLASIANVAPFVGLFGTVFGIIHALHAAGAAGGDVGSVAGPVGDALFATGLGIAVAIPAVLGYNAFVRRAHVSIGELEEFASELADLAERNGFGMYENPSALRLPISAAPPAATHFGKREAAA